MPKISLPQDRPTFEHHFNCAGRSAAVMAETWGVTPQGVRERAKALGVLLSKSQKMGRHASVNYRCASGRKLSFLNPDPASISLSDIAHSLANTNRWNGHPEEQFTVAEHVVRVAEAVYDETERPDAALCALHHDDAETYIGDINSQFKKLLGSKVATIDNGITVVIMAKFGLADSWKKWKSTVKRYDEALGHLEAVTLRMDGWATIDGVQTRVPFEVAHRASLVPDHDIVSCMAPAQAKGLYLEMHEKLMNLRGAM